MIAELLAQLGSTAEQIAESLRKAGIRGRQRNTCNCPIANWMKTRPGIVAISTCRKRIMVIIEADCIVEPTPPAVQDFITDFDGECYRDLRA